MRKVGKRWIIKTAGFSDDDNLYVDSGRWECGKIKDGILFEHDHSGSWLISEKDILKLAGMITTGKI